MSALLSYNLKILVILLNLDAYIAVFLQFNAWVWFSSKYKLLFLLKYM